MHVALLLQELPVQPTAADADVLSQCDRIERALSRLGHTTVRVSFGMDLGQVQEQLRRTSPDVVFNLVESVNGTDRLMPLATLLLESLDLCFTGSSSQAILSSSGKVAAKRIMHTAALPTPAWLVEDGKTSPLDGAVWQGMRTQSGLVTPQSAIVKTVWEHASFGMDDDSVVRCTGSETAPADFDREVFHRIRQRFNSTGKLHFAEEYIHGREFNLSLLSRSSGVEVLPPAEIRFIGFAPERPHLVGYQAKWDESSPDYQNTPRTFDFTAEEEPLLQNLCRIAASCWEVFGLRGWARVDFRVDSEGQPWILEINANPCLSEDAGFAAAVERAGLNYEEAIERILQDALVPRL